MSGTFGTVGIERHDRISNAKATGICLADSVVLGTEGFDAYHQAKDLFMPVSLHVPGHASVDAKALARDVATVVSK